MITVKPHGGLGNRMRVIDSAWLLAKRTGKHLTVVWEMSAELNCSFTDLFLLPDTLSLKEYKSNGIGNRISALLSKSMNKLGVHLPAGYDFYLFNKDILTAKSLDADLPAMVKGKKSIYIDTVHRFFYDEGTLSEFSPIPELQSSIDSYTSQFIPPTVGVHIRRTDNAESIRYSPLIHFKSFMKQEIESFKDTQFFLATDSMETELELKELFPGRIITQQKTLDRNTVSGIQGALVDLYCLSKTKKIIGSHFSSFSEVASQIEGIPLQQIYAEV